MVPNARGIVVHFRSLAAHSVARCIALSKPGQQSTAWPLSDRVSTAVPGMVIRVYLPLLVNWPRRTATQGVPP
jgi:hypothetical protein